MGSPGFLRFTLRCAARRKGASRAIANRSAARDSHEEKEEKVLLLVTATSSVLLLVTATSSRTVEEWV